MDRGGFPGLRWKLRRGLWAKPRGKPDVIWLWAKSLKAIKGRSTRLKRTKIGVMELQGD